MTLALFGGALGVLGRVKLCLKFLSLHPWSAGAPTALLATPMLWYLYFLAIYIPCISTSSVSQHA